MALVGKNTRLEVEQTLDTAKNITAITKANPAVVTSNAHGYSNGDVVVLDGIAGMVELNGQICRVANVTTNTFELESIDSSSFGTYVSGGTAREITAWQTIADATQVDFPSATPSELNATTLLDTEQQIQFGATPRPAIQVSLFSAPLTAAMVKVESAAALNQALGFRVTMSDGSKRLFRGYPSSAGETIAAEQLVTAAFSVAQIKRKLAFAS